MPWNIDLEILGSLLNYNQFRDKRNEKIIGDKTDVQRLGVKTGPDLMGWVYPKELKTITNQSESFLKRHLYRFTDQSYIEVKKINFPYRLTGKERSKKRTASRQSYRIKRTPKVWKSLFIYFTEVLNDATYFITSSYGMDNWHILGSPIYGEFYSLFATIPKSESKEYQVQGRSLASAYPELFYVYLYNKQMAKTCLKKARDAMEGRTQKRISINDPLFQIHAAEFYIELKAQTQTAVNKLKSKGLVKDNLIKPPKPVGSKTPSKKKQPVLK